MALVRLRHPSHILLNKILHTPTSEKGMLVTYLLSIGQNYIRSLHQCKPVSSEL